MSINEAHQTVIRMVAYPKPETVTLQSIKRGNGVQSEERTKRLCCGLGSLQKTRVRKWLIERGKFLLSDTERETTLSSPLPVPANLTSPFAFLTPKELLFSYNLRY